MSIRVRLPNGKVLKARLSEATEDGYRKAYVRVPTNHWVSQVSVSGRVTARHGFDDDRILPFEVNMGGSNAADAFRGSKRFIA